ncbi:MAG: hypothetical protein ACXVAT_13380 [Isosphaeraceae bacterium]
MHIVVEHRIIDLDKFSSMDAAEVAGGGGPGFNLRQFLPPQDGSVATCLWEAESIDSLREWLDPATAGVTENTYIAIDDENAIGLPEAAAAGS